jgi:hypothetical protein
MWRKRTLLLWVPATLIAVMAVAEGARQVRTHAPRRAAATCTVRELSADLDGDGRIETVQVVRLGDEAWADVWSSNAMRSTTRIGAWHDDLAIAVFDMNGDGKLDLISRWSEGGEAHGSIWFADELGFAEGPSGVTGSPCYAQR